MNRISRYPPSFTHAETVRPMLTLTALGQSRPNWALFGMSGFTPDSDRTQGHRRWSGSCQNWPWAPWVRVS